MEAVYDVLRWLAARDDIRNQIFVFAFGAMVSMLISNVSPERRSFGQLLAGSMFGGIGAVIAFRVYTGWLWEIVTGFAALGAERIALGARKIFDDFSRNPFGVIRKILVLISVYTSAIRDVKMPEDAPIEPSMPEPPVDGQDGEANL